MLNLDRLFVVLVSTRNPLNIGAAARAMSNFGFSCLRLVNPYEPSFREARSAVGAAALLAKAEQYTSVAEAVADCSLIVGTTAARNRELQHPLKPLAAGARLIRKRMTAGRVALLFGSEKRGLSNRDLSYCHWLLHIPTQQAHVSMNLGQAVAVCLYELARDRNKTSLDEKVSVANANELERIMPLLLQISEASGYINPSAASGTEEKIRRLVYRMKLSKSDAELWIGILRQIDWKVKQSK